MTPEQFVYWLQGYSEVAGERPSADQWKAIQDHLKIVFHKVTPDYTNYPPIPRQDPPFPYDNPIINPRVIC